MHDRLQNITVPTGITSEEVGLILSTKKLTGIAPAKLKLTGVSRDGLDLDPVKEANGWIRHFEAFMNVNQIPAYAWSTYMPSHLEDDVQDRITTWIDGFRIPEDLNAIVPWEIVRECIRGMAKRLAKEGTEHRLAFRNATLESVCCENIGPNGQPRDVMAGLDLLTRLAQRAGRNTNERDQTFLEDIVEALPEEIRVQCRNPHSETGMWAYHSIVNVLRAEGPRLKAQWKAKMEGKKTPQPTARLQVAEVRDAEPDREPSPPPKRPRATTAWPEPSVSQASVMQPAPSPAPTTTHVGLYPAPAQTYVQHVVAQPSIPTIQLQYQQPAPIPQQQPQYQAYQQPLPPQPQLPQPAPQPQQYQQHHQPPQPYQQPAPQQYGQQPAPQQYGQQPAPQQYGQQPAPFRNRRGAQEPRPRVPVPPARYGAAGNLLPPDPLPEGWEVGRRKPAQGPFYPDYAQGCLMWVRGCSFPKWDYAREYGACKICLKKGHYCQQCPELRNMRFEEDYVFYLPITNNGQQRH